MFGFGKEKRKVKVGVVGVGVLGRYHTNIYSKSSNAELVGVYDAEPKAAEAIAKEFQTKAFPTIRELAEQCDALSVAVPATLHHKVAMELIGLKMIRKQKKYSLFPESQLPLLPQHRWGSGLFC